MRKLRSAIKFGNFDINFQAMLRQLIIHVILSPRVLYLATLSALTPKQGRNASLSPILLQ